MNKKQPINLSNKQTIVFENSKTIGEQEPTLLSKYTLFRKKTNLNQEYKTDMKPYKSGENKEQQTTDQTFLKVTYYQHSDHLLVSKKGNGHLKVRPNSIDDVLDDSKTKELPIPSQSNIADWFDRNEEDNE